MDGVNVPSDPTRDQFVLTGHRRAALAVRAAIFVGLTGVGVAALALAIAKPSGDGQGGAGNLVIPVLAIAGGLLALLFTLGQWWDDATHLRVADGRLEVRHGGGRASRRAVVFDATAPVTVESEGGRLFLQQGQTRINVGNARTLGVDQIRAWESWMRAHAIRLQRPDKPGR